MVLERIDGVLTEDPCLGIMKFPAFLLISALLSGRFCAALERTGNGLLSSSGAHDEARDGVNEESEVTSEEKPKAQFPAVCGNAVYHVQSQGDMNFISEQCSHITGSIIVDGEYSDPVLDTGELQNIGGSLEVHRIPGLVRMDLPNVAVIDGTFGLKELTSLTSINAPTLNKVGVIDWKVLPILSTVNFDSGLFDINSITISDTSLIGFSGFAVESLDTLNINNNRFMDTISCNLKGVTRKLSVSANARNAAVSFPNLEYANNITVRDVASLNVQNIEHVNASMELINNDFQTVKLPKLKHIGGTLSLIENHNLRDPDFPAVEDVGGGLMVINNTNVNKISFLPKLQSVGGAIEFVGDFKETSFGRLNLVRGSAIIKSSYEDFDCSRWIRGGDQNGTQASIIRGGKIICTSAGKQQVVKYDTDGAIVDEEISYIDDSETQDGRVGENGALRATRGGDVSFISFALVMAIVLVSF